MERKNLIKAGGGALTKTARPRRTVDPSVNQPATAQCKADLKYLRFLNWLTANGAVFPRVEFPVAFGPDALVGAMAKEDIHASTAFIFIPDKLCISESTASESELSDLFLHNPYVFSGREDGGSYMLYVFLMAEKLKMSSSFYSPYFDVVRDNVLLADWSEEELRELQDPHLAIEATDERKRVEEIWTELKDPLSDHPAFQFSPEAVEEAFQWAYRAVCTRQFGQEEDVLVPLADHLNHGCVYVGLASVDEATLRDATQEVDYRDFDGKRTVEEKPLPKRTFTNRLEKFMKANPKARVKVNSIWEVNSLVSEYRSSSDEEAHSSEEEVESEDEEEEEEPAQPTAGNYYYVLKTGQRSSFKAGKQIFNCYGSLSNRQLLLHYGFAMEGNPYDSLRVRVWKAAFRQKFGLVSIEDIIAQPYKEELSSAKLSDVTQVFHLKRNKVNHSLFTYFRQAVIAEMQANPALTKSVSSLMLASPTTEMVEIPVVTRVLQLLQDAGRQRFVTTLDNDTFSDADSLPLRTRFALRYRISQKRILKGQTDLMQRLLAILKKMEGGVELVDAHMSQGSVEELYPLMSYLRSFQCNHARWLKEATPAAS